MYLAVALVALIAVGCGKVEKILPRKDGLWKVTSETVTEFVNGVQDTTYTDTDSLSIVMFADDGTGYSTDFDGKNKLPFEWSVNSDNDQITITDSTTIPLVFDVLESSNKEMTWQGSITFSLFGITVRSDIKQVLERQN
jgi:hypothetical protein